MPTRIHQTESFNATPQAVFDLLTDSEKFSSMTGGAPAEIDSASGGTFSLFGGAITGQTIETVAAKRVVQAWRPGTWEPGSYSLVRFDIESDGEGSRVTLDHAGFPEAEGEHLAQGWQDNYWAPMHAATEA